MIDMRYVFDGLPDTCSVMCMSPNMHEVHSAWGVCYMHVDVHNAWRVWHVIVCDMSCGFGVLCVASNVCVGGCEMACV